MTKLRNFGRFTFVRARGRKGSKVGKFNLSKIASIVLVFCIATAIASPTQTFTTLVSFDGTNGADSTAPLIQGTDGNYLVSYQALIGLFLDCSRCKILILKRVVGASGFEPPTSWPRTG
jgi:hypothetical protein